VDGLEYFGAGFGVNSFFVSQNNTSDETNNVSNANIKRQYSSAIPLLHHCLPVFDKICGMGTNFAFFIRVTLITPPPIHREWGIVFDRFLCLYLSFFLC